MLFPSLLTTVKSPLSPRFSGHPTSSSTQISLQSSTPTLDIFVSHAQKPTQPMPLFGTDAPRKLSGPGEKVDSIRTVRRRRQVEEEHRATQIRDLARQIQQLEQHSPYNESQIEELQDQLDILAEESRSYHEHRLREEHRDQEAIDDIIRRGRAQLQERGLLPPQDEVEGPGRGHGTHGSMPVHTHPIPRLTLHVPPIWFSRPVHTIPSPPPITDISSMGMQVTPVP